MKGTDCVGGVVAAYGDSGKSITSCANYGEVTNTGVGNAGGMAGFLSQEPFRIVPTMAM